MARPLQDPAYLGRMPPDVQPRERSPWQDAFAHPDTDLSRGALVLGGLIVIIALVVAALSAWSRTSLIAACYGAAIACLGALNFYLSSLWRRPALCAWQRALVVLGKVVVIGLLLPVVMLLIGIGSLLYVLGLFEIWPLLWIHNLTNALVDVVLADRMKRR